jgi:hypothetical protein
LSHMGMPNLNDLLLANECFDTQVCELELMQRTRELERIRDHSAVSLRSTPVDDVESDHAAYEAFVFVSDYGTFTGANKNHDHHWRK